MISVAECSHREGVELRLQWGLDLIASELDAMQALEGPSSAPIERKRTGGPSAASGTERRSLLS
eukprot:6777911-Alexandrium_andersonii.AAC.1